MLQPKCKPMRGACQRTSRSPAAQALVSSASTHSQPPPCVAPKDGVARALQKSPPEVPSLTHLQAPPRVVPEDDVARPLPGLRPGLARIARELGQRAPAWPVLPYGTHLRTYVGKRFEVKDPLSKSTVHPQCHLQYFLYQSHSDQPLSHGHWSASGQVYQMRFLGRRLVRCTQSPR